MKSRDIFLPSLGSILVAGMVGFLSCAHQNRNAEDMDMPSEDMASESSSESGSEGLDQAASGEETGSPSGDMSNSEASSDLETLADNTTGSGTQDNVDPLEKDLESLETQSSQDTTAQPKENQVAAKEPSLEDQLEGLDSGTSSTTPDSKAVLETSPAESTLSSSSGLEEPSTSLDPVQPKTDELNARSTISTEIEPLSSETLNIDKPAPKKAFRASNRVPKIPAKAIKRSGSRLNRFYFVRKGDTPKKVANLIYGSAKKSSKLIQWNGANWTPGKVIYYVSAQNPKDPKMDSFYKEHGISAEEHVVSSGEWLSKIAKDKLGSPKSWTEIAVVNGINKPKALEVGQKIAIYPADLSYSQGQSVAQNQPVQQPQSNETRPVQPPPVVEPPVREAPIEEASPTPVAPVKEPVKSAPVGFNVQKFIEQNMFAGLMGLAGFFLILLLIVKKRNRGRAGSQDDFLDGEEGFQPPTKLKRK